MRQPLIEIKIIKEQTTIKIKPLKKKDGKKSKKKSYL